MSAPSRPSLDYAMRRPDRVTRLVSRFTDDQLRGLPVPVLDFLAGDRSHA